MNDDDKKHKQALESEQSGNEDPGGTMADLESDDNVLDNAHNMDLYQKADEEHPQELNIAKEVEKAEKQHQKND